MRRASIGSLRHRLVLERPVRTPTEAGAAIETWETVTELFASITPLRGTEPFRHDRVSGDALHSIRFRYRSGVLPAMRLRRGTRVFEILSIADEDERSRWLVVTAKETTP